MSLNVDAIAKEMIVAVKGVVHDSWPTTRKYFESEAKIYAQRLYSIEKMVNDGIISENRAKEHIAVQKKVWDSTLIAIDGLNDIMVEQSLNAAIKVIRDAVNKAIGFALL